MRTTKPRRGSPAVSAALVLAACAALGCNDMLGLESPSLGEGPPAASTTPPAATSTDPATSLGAWQSVSLPKLSIGRALHTATLAPNGDVVFWGGCSGSSGSKANEPSIDVLHMPVCHDPGDSDCWTMLPEQGEQECRHAHAAVAARGRVVVAGGFVAGSEGALTTAARYDPSDGTMASMDFGAGAGHWTATLLEDGRTLLNGGSLEEHVPPTSGAKMALFWGEFDDDDNYVPPPGAIEDVCDQGKGCPSARTFHTATLLGDGSVLIAGGADTTMAGNKESSPSLDTAERFFPDLGASIPNLPAMRTARWGHAAVRLADGRVLLCGGKAGAETVRSVEIFDPIQAAFEDAAPMNAARWGHTATLLGDGRVLVVGGSDEPNAEVYDALEDTWTRTEPMAETRFFHTATRLPDGNVLVAGGRSVGIPLPAANAFDSLELYVVPSP